MTCLRHLIFCAAVGLSLLTLTPHCAAQTDESDNAASLAQRDNEIRIVNDVLDQFWSVMDPSEQAILREIDVRIPMDYDMTRVIAYRQDGRVIEISFGFYGILVKLCRAWILALYYAEQDPTIHEKYEAYLAYLNDTIDQNDRSIGQDPVAPQSFAEFAGIPEETEAQIMSSGDAEYNNAALGVTAIAFVLAHEIGHHVLGHVDAPPASAAESRAREAEADRYAAALTMRAGLPAFGALPALAIFTSVEDEFIDPEATHPIASCRILGALMYTVDRLAEDEATVHLFENDPDMLPGGSRYQHLMALMNENCS